MTIAADVEFDILLHENPAVAVGRKLIESRVFHSAFTGIGRRIKSYDRYVGDPVEMMKAGLFEKNWFCTYLMSGVGRLPPDWVVRYVESLNMTNLVALHEKLTVLKKQLHAESNVLRKAFGDLNYPK